MADQELNIPTPSIAKSSSFSMTGQGFNNVAPKGEATFSVGLPVSKGRGVPPQLALSYSSQAGNGPFGLGWGLNNGQIRRRTDKGSPRYDDDDEIVGHDQQICTKERNADGSIQTRIENTFNGRDIGAHTVVRYTPEVESDFSLRERWEPVHPTDRQPTFWLISAVDGSLHLYGKTANSRVADPQDPLRVAIWLLCESMTAHGEHICYEYKSDDEDSDDVRDFSSQRYPYRVFYGNFIGSQHLYGWTVENPADLDWHFHLLFDYGERSTSLSEKPAYDAPVPLSWPVRPDASSTFGHRFEIATRRRCEQVLMFHYFPGELGNEPVLVRRLLLKYSERLNGWNYSQLTSAHEQAWGANDDVESSPPLQFDYEPLQLNQIPARLFPDENMPGIDDGRSWHCVDLYGEGVPGFLHRHDQAWFYREPVRGQSGPDDIAYGPWTILENIPVNNSKKPALQILAALSGSGRFDWLTAQHGFAGLRSLNPDRTWSEFKTFTRTPTELLGTFARFGDLANEGLLSVVVNSPGAVRFYRSALEEGFQQAEEVLREPDDDRLPLFGDARSELVMFGNLLGSDTSELCRIRHDEIKCWPNLGFGKFGKGRVLKGPVFEYSTFDASRVRIADLDGSGAPALIYLNGKSFDIYLNHGGNGLAADPISVPLPEGVQYEQTCEVTFADLQGLGCASLILSVPHMKPRHWRYDFVSARPYLMKSSNNNMGCSASIVYRSSAQEWLDEKRELAARSRQVPACYLPTNVQLVKQQFQLDEITGNCLSQHFIYREGYYDPHAREYRGFGYLEQTDSESLTGAEDSSFTAPIRACSWYITGQSMNRSRTGYFAGDNEAVPLGDTVITRYDPVQGRDIPFTPPPDSTLPYEIARGMAGTLMRSEIYNGDEPAATAKPYVVEEYRYLVREVRPKGEHYPDAIILPLALEKISYQYEQFIDDPLCRHEVGLRWDQYGASTHSLVVSYARRRIATDTPPFSDEDENRWWLDAHDEAQQHYYISESRARLINLDTDAQRRRLGLAWQQRGDALVMPTGQLPSGLNPQAVSFEQLTEFVDSPQWHALRTLTHQSEQRYLKTADQSLLDSGEAEYEALAGPVELAQLDKTALDAYGELPPPFAIRQALREIGYLPMRFFFEPASSSDEENLWSSTFNYARYDDLAGFFKVLAFNETPSHGVTEAIYDAYRIGVIRVTLPDGCATSVTYDYLTLQPLRILDANENTQEVIYDASGQPLALSDHGTENGVIAGFHHLSDYVLPESLLPGPAIEDPVGAIQGIASTLRKDLFSWMGSLPPGINAELLADWIANGDVLPSGHICANARQRLQRHGALTAADQALQELIASIPRVPVHRVILSADRYPNDSVAAQIHIIKTCFDGFGRELQTQQLVDPGMANAVDADGSLIVEDGKLREVHAAPRWRISARVEYNNKGLPVRQFRPFFADTYRYVNDASLREHGYFDQLFYDVLGRPIRLVNAKGYFSRETYHPWYHTREDFNDTDESESMR